MAYSMFHTSAVKGKNGFSKKKNSGSFYEESRNSGSFMKKHEQKVAHSMKKYTNDG